MNMSREQHDRTMMAAEVLVGEMNSWIVNLDDAGLGNLRSLIKICIEDKRSLMYNLGRIETMLEMRGVCLCGEMHSPEEAQRLQGGHTATIKTAEPERTFDLSVDRSTGLITPIRPEGDSLELDPRLIKALREGNFVTLPNMTEVAWIQPELDLTNDTGVEGEASPAENMIANAEQWEVRFVDPETLTGKVECILCGSEYQSLDDRMRREPGFAGCHFCHTKSRLG